jgi:hypothetical protein
MVILVPVKRSNPSKRLPAVPLIQLSILVPEANKLSGHYGSPKAKDKGYPVPDRLRVIPGFFIQ